jgi:hypothetical protein
MDKWVCQECRFIGAMEDFDHVQDPRSDLVWVVCPECRTPSHVTMACDEPGCSEDSTCGFPTEAGYRRTCGKHYRQRPKPLQAGPPT